MEENYKIKTPGVHHIGLRVSDYERAKQFYLQELGFDLILENPGLFIFFAGQTAIAIRGPEANMPEGDVFNPHRIGLDHVALGCEKMEDLIELEKKLKKAGIENTGIKLDETLNKKYIAFKDPDRISWEYYMI